MRRRKAFRAVHTAQTHTGTKYTHKHRCIYKRLIRRRLGMGTARTYVRGIAFQSYEHQDCGLWIRWCAKHVVQRGWIVETPVDGHGRTRARAERSMRRRYGSLRRSSLADPDGAYTHGIAGVVALHRLTGSQRGITKQEKGKSDPSAQKKRKNC